MKKLILSAITAIIITPLIITNAVSCYNWGGIKGNGDVIKKEITGLNGFEKIGSGISADIVLTQGSEFKVVYEGESNLLDYIKFEVKNGVLDIENKKDNQWIQTTKPMKISITLPALTKVMLGGSGNISATTDFDSDRMEVALGGSGNIKLSGTATRLKIALGGSGNINLMKMKSEEAKVAIGGSGNCEVQVSKELDVAIGGSGNVVCKGRPNVKKSIGGSGEIELVD